MVIKNRKNNMKDVLSTIKDFLIIVFLITICCYFVSDEFETNVNRNEYLVGKEVVINDSTRVVTYFSITEGCCYLDNGTKVDPKYVEMLISKKEQ